MLTCNIGKPHKTSTDKLPTGTPTSKSMTTRSDTSQEKLMYPGCLIVPSRNRPRRLRQSECNADPQKQIQSQSDPKRPLPLQKALLDGHLPRPPFHQTPQQR